MNVGKHYMVVGAFCMLCIGLGIPFAQCYVHKDCHIHSDESPRFIKIVNLGTTPSNASGTINNG